MSRFLDVVNQWSAGSDYAASGGAYPGTGDSLALMATSPGVGDTGAWTTGGEVGPDDGMGGGGMSGWTGSDYGDSSYGYDDYGGTDSDYDDNSYDGSGMSAGGSSQGAPVGSYTPGDGGNILVGFAVTAGFLVGGGWLLHRYAGREEARVGELVPSLINGMKVGALGVVFIPLYRAAFAQLAFWGVPLANDASAYANGA